MWPVSEQWAVSNHNAFESYCVEIRGMFGQGATRSGRTERVRRTIETLENQARRGATQSPTSEAGPIVVDPEHEEVLCDV